MDEREKMMFERIKPERHISAVMTLATLKFIKEECTKNKNCINCRFHVPSSESLSDCIFNKADIPQAYDEYEITERIYK